MRNDVFPTGILAYTLLHAEAALREMCFIDNEFGSASDDRIDAIALRVVKATNASFAAHHRYLRVFAIRPYSKLHHRIVVEWGIIAHTTEDENGDCTDVPMQLFAPLIANLYPPSKRVQVDEDEDRVGPRRGEKLRRPKKTEASLNRQKKKVDFNVDHGDKDARDSGGEIDSHHDEMASV